MSEKVPFYLENEAREQEKKNQLATSERKRRLNDIRALLKLPQGRRYIWDELSRTGVMNASFTENSNRTAFNEGKRDIGLSLLADLMEAEPTAFAQMQREAYSEAKSRKQEE